MSNDFSHRGKEMNALEKYAAKRKLAGALTKGINAVSVLGTLAVLGAAAKEVSKGKKAWFRDKNHPQNKALRAAFRRGMTKKGWAKLGSKRDPRLERAGVSGYNKAKRTPGHPTKSHIVVAKEGDRVKTIRFGQQGVKTNQTAGQRKAFKSRHAKNISKGRMSAAYWADKAKWSPSKTKDKDNQKWVKGS